jgi:hypothetical protein
MQWRPQEVRDSQEHGTSAKETAGKKQSQPKREAMWLPPARPWCRAIKILWSSYNATCLAVEL